MTRLGPISPKKLEKVLLKMGFTPTRQSGSHVFYKHPDGRCTTIPFHGNYEIGVVLLCKILKETKVSREEFERCL